MNINNVLEFIEQCSEDDFQGIKDAVAEAVGESKSISVPKKTLADAEKEKILNKLYNKLSYKELAKIEEIYL